jgi:hypothetical protein
VSSRRLAVVVACYALLATAIDSPAQAISRAAGLISFRDNYELGQIDTSRWSIQCQPWLSDTNRGIVRLVTRPVDRGPRAARIDLPPDERGSACELLRSRKVGLGTDDYYSVAYRFPLSWRAPSVAFWGLVVAQFNYQLIWGAPVGLAVHSDRMVLTAQTGYCNDVHSASPGCTYSNGSGGGMARRIRCRPSCQVIPRARLTLGVWHKIVVRVRWAADSTGLIEAWHRTARTPWVKSVTITGYPTVQWSNERPLSGWEQNAWETNDKLGAYRGAASWPLTVYNDGFCVATSFSSAASCLA